MEENFEIFDEKVGVDGYYNKLIGLLLNPPDMFNFTITTFQMPAAEFLSDAIFSRVRRVNEQDALGFLSGKISILDFYPPEKNVSQGRFNSPNKSVLYLANHPEIAISECGIKEKDFYLMSQIAFTEKKIFISLAEESERLSEGLDVLLKLARSKDTRFYQVLSRLSETFLDYEGFSGILYKTVKPYCFENKLSGNNLAITDDYKTSTRLVFSLLMAPCETGGHKILALFEPDINNNIKTTKISDAGWQQRYDAVIKSVNEMSKNTADRTESANKESVEPIEVVKWFDRV